MSASAVTAAVRVLLGCATVDRAAVRRRLPQQGTYLAFELSRPVATVAAQYVGYLSSNLVRAFQLYYVAPLPARGRGGVMTVPATYRTAGLLYVLGTHASLKIRHLLVHMASMALLSSLAHISTSRHVQRETLLCVSSCALSECSFHQPSSSFVPTTPSPTLFKIMPPAVTIRWLN